jgi:hypothetical protein
MDEATELLGWLLGSNLITLDDVRQWKVSADLAIENGVRSQKRLDGLIALISWYEVRRVAAEDLEAATYLAQVGQWRIEQVAREQARQG